MAQCRSCGAPVLWVLTKGGRKVPLDPQSVLNGNLVITREETKSGCLPRVAYVAPEPDVERFVAHFASCTNARGYRHA